MIPRPLNEADIGSMSEERSDVAVSPVEQLKKQLPNIARQVGVISVCSSFLGPFIYSFTVRKLAWRTSLLWARFFRYDIPHAAELSILPPYHISLILRSAISGFLLLFLWRISNLAFTVYVAQEPLKRGQPISQDSRDPNGVLINGLYSKKSLVKVKQSLVYVTSAE